MAFTYGVIFDLDGKRVCYRYINRKKSSKVLVSAKTHKPIKRTRGDSSRFKTISKR